MKKFIFIFATLFTFFCITSFIVVADAPEKEPDDPAGSEIRVIFKIDPEGDSDKYYDESKMEDNGEALLLELLGEIRRLREEIRALQDEIAHLRGLIEQSPMPRHPLIRRSEGRPPRKFVPEFQPEEYWNPESKDVMEQQYERNIHE